MDDHSADQLDVIVPLTQSAERSLPGQGERFGKQIVKRFAVRCAFAKRVCFFEQLLILELLHLGLDPVDRLDPLFVCLELAPLPHPERTID